MSRATLDSSALYWATFNRFELRIPGECAMACSHSGACDADVAHWAPRVAELVKADAFANGPTPDTVRAELAEYGAWDEDELADDAANWARVVWLAAGQVTESDAPDCSEPIRA